MVDFPQLLEMGCEKNLLGTSFSASFLLEIKNSEAVTFFHGTFFSLRLATILSVNSNKPYTSIISIVFIYSLLLNLYR